MHSRHFATLFRARSCPSSAGTVIPSAHDIEALPPTNGVNPKLLDAASNFATFVPCTCANHAGDGGLLTLFGNRWIPEAFVVVANG